MSFLLEKSRCGLASPDFVCQNADMKHEDLETFLIIQERDVHITRLEKELASLPELRTKIIKGYQQAKAKVEAKKKVIVDSELYLQTLEQEIEQKKNYISKVKIQQADTKKNEEYQRFGSEIIKTMEVIDQLETKALELMDELELARSTFKHAQEKLIEFKRTAEEDLARFDHTATQDQSRLQDMRRERSTWAIKVSADDLALYERMGKGKGFPFIIPMTEEGCCSACNMELTAGVKADVLANHTPVPCGNCGKLLY